MTLKITSIGSSSSGNSYIIQSESCALLLDVGLSGKKIRAGIAAAGLSEKDIKGILLTHEHVDHVGSVRMMAKVCDRAQIYTSRGTAFGTKGLDKVDESRISCIYPGDSFELGDIQVKTFPLSHDAAEPLSYSFTKDDDTLAVVTDTGIVTEEIFAAMLDANKLVFEANHEEQLLLFGPYPYNVKRRILGEQGHLSNRAAGEALSKVLEERRSDKDMSIMLAHLSSNNNTPGQAEFTVTEVLTMNGFERNRDYSLSIALKEGLTVLE